MNKLSDIAASPTEELGRWGKFVWFQFKVWPQCLGLLRRNRAGQQAAALSYHTIFGIVPLAIIVLMVFQLFPEYTEYGDKLKNTIYDYLNLSQIKYTSEESPEDPISLTAKIDEIASRFTANLNKGAITIFNVLFVTWAALGLLMTIERSFNCIWHVTRGRKIIHRIVNYWALLTFGPILLIVGFYLNTKIVAENGFVGVIYNFFYIFVPYFITVIVFFFLYYLMPNTNVNPRAALWGAAVAALVWSGAKYLFAIYVMKFIPQQTVYGVMGIIPLSVIWIFITWVIVLFGLQLTYATQHLKSLDAEQINKMKKAEEYFLLNDLTVIRIMAYVLEVFDARKGAVSIDQICDKFELSTGIVERIVNHLISKGLLLKVTEPEESVVLAAEPKDISLADIADAVSIITFAQKDEDMPEKLKEVIGSRTKTLSQTTLRDLVK